MFISACTSLKLKSRANLYENTTSKEASQFLRLHIPFSSATLFRISQGAFGRQSHQEKGNEYSWDFDVPYGTPVTAALSGKVIEIWEPRQGDGCDPQFSNLAHNIKIQHDDGSVAQYVHIEPRVEINDSVKTGQVIAVTAKNGWVCTPQLHFGVYKSKDHLYQSVNRETLPLYFIEIPGGLAKPGFQKSAR